MPHDLKIADCLGFCGGVQRAMRLFEETRRAMPSGEPLFVLHELVHNRCVTEEMRRQGARFIETPQDLPAGATVLIGAHGVSPETADALRARAARVLDATCPIVRQLQAAAAALTPDDELVFCGLHGHPEAEGVLGSAGTPRRFLVAATAEVDALPPLRHPILLTQTTLNHETADALFAALQRRFPHARRTGAICRASFERQSAVERLVREVDALLVIGSPHSSNASRLREIGERAGIPAWLVEGPEQFPPDLGQYRRVGIAAGASTPQAQIDRAIQALQER